MRVLFLNSARSWGGNEKWTHLAAHALARRHETFLAYRGDAVGTRFDIPAFRLPFVSELDPVSIGRLIRIVRREAVDVLIPTKRKDYFLAGLVSRVCGCANVLRLGIVRTPGPVDRLIYRRWADGILVNAERIRGELLRSVRFPPGAVRVIHNGLDVEALEGASEGGAAGKPFGFTVVSAGRLIPRKGFEVLIDGFARFLERCRADDAGLVLLGDGELSESLKRRAGRLGIAGRVRFEGFLKNPYPAMRASDVYVSMSENEGISNAMIEAMVLGNAVVTTRAGGAEEVVVEGRSGFLLEGADSDALVDRLCRLEGNREETGRMGTAARERALTMFRLDRMTSELEAFLADRISRR